MPRSHRRARPRSTGASRTERARPSCARPSRCVILGGRRTNRKGGPGMRREREGPSPERSPTARRRETAVAKRRSTIEEAGDPHTGPERQIERTEKNQTLNRLIAQEPPCKEAMRQWILATNPWAKQAYEESLAGTPGAPEEPSEAPGEPDEAESEDPDAVSVWGDLGAAAASSDAAQEAPA